MTSPWKKNPLALHVPVSNIGTRIIGTYSTNPGAGGADRTYMNQIALDQHFDAVRLVYANINASGFLLGEVAIGTGNGGTAGSPDKYGNAANNWIYASFGGVTPSTGSPLTVPATSGSAADPDFYFSDWMNISSITPTDGQSLPYVWVRTYLPSTITAYTVCTFGDSGKGVDQWGDHAPGGRVWRNQWVSGNKATVTAGAVPAWSSQGDHVHSGLCAIQYLARGRVINVMAVGDSIAQGLNATAETGVTVQGASAVQRACSTVSNINGIAVQYSGCGISAQTIDQYYTRLARMLPLFKPEVVVFSAGTPNNTSKTQAGMNTEASYTAKAIQTCKDNGALPIITTEIPRNSADGVSYYNSTQDGFRQAFNAQLNGMANNGVLIADLDASLSAGGVPAAAAAGTMSAGGTWMHPNDVGYAAMAVPVTAQLSDIVGSNS